MDAAVADEAQATNAGVGGRRRRIWGSLRHSGSLGGSPSPHTEAAFLGGTGRLLDGPWDDVDDGPVTIGPGAAAAAETADRQSFVDAELAGIVISPSRSSGAVRRSRAEEQEAKRLLFGRQLGGGGARGGRGAVGPSTGGNSGKSLFKRLAFSTRRTGGGGAGGGSSVGGGPGGATQGDDDTWEGAHP